MKLELTVIEMSKLYEILLEVDLGDSDDYLKAITLKNVKHEIEGLFK